MEAISINPEFNDLNKPETILKHIQDITKNTEPTPHTEILNQLVGQFEPLDFEALAFPQVEKLRGQLEALSPESEQTKEILKQLDKLKVNTKHYLVLSIENVLLIAEKKRWGLCKNMEFIYLYNGAYWAYIEKEVFQKFLGEASEKMSVAKFTARFYEFREKLIKQFISTAYLPTPEPPKEAVYINLKNGTFEVTTRGTKLRPFDRGDFLTYQLPFDYNPEAKAPLFQLYLNRVLPDIERQKILAEFLGYVFVKNGNNNLKEEKALILYGTGANGKSVFFEIVNALLGVENVCSYSLQSLTDTTGYYRAMIANKLVNYASEINGNLETSIFKQLVSGEPVEARLPYGKPMQIKQYAKLIFNCNELPKEVEHTNAYFRRFLIIPFDVTIPEHEQDKQLHTKIIESELSGVFNWVLEGLNTLLEQKKFSDCEAAKQAVEKYKTQSDSVKLFIEENGYQPSPDEYRVVKELYTAYRTYCLDDGFKPVNKTNFIKRLQGFGVQIEKKNIGNVAFLSFENGAF
ncbi:MAG TPA: phage/plasmid primase, P4 family [Chitinophagaceae bacterium]|jgi:putative DNA primase/helicase|nr:phage/plasmid primase, P4 family [Chitinophagaceae bacterium]